MAVDAGGNAHVVGSTDSADFSITIGAFQPSLGSAHDIITKFDNGEPGTNDTFTISITNGPTEGGVLRRGNISIQQ
jgi:hypothetical protein